MYLSKEIQNQLNELSGIDKRIEIEHQIITRNQLIIAITIDKYLINIESSKILDIIRFILLLKSDYPNTPPILYCISRFCEPELCDGRDLLEDTLQMKWNPKSFFLKLIVSQIPSFIQRYLLYYSKKDNNNTSELILKRKIFGKYYLDSIYELSIIKYIPYLYFDTISEIVSIKGKKMNIEDRKIVITDNFVLLFCNKNLYELDQLKLIFVGPITSLVYIRQLAKNGIVLLKWITKGKGLGLNSYYIMQLKTEDGDYIVDTLIENLSRSSIDFNITNKINGNIKREGSVPMVDINSVEEKVKQIENKINNKEDINKENISILVNLYEKAIQYYSALNNEKFKIYIKKLHNIYANNEYTSLLNMKTISSSDNQYNVAHFKRKRKKGDEENKKRKEKKLKKKNEDEKKEIKNEKDIKDDDIIENKEEKIIINNDKEQNNKEVEQKKEDTNKKEVKKDLNNNEINNKIENNEINNNLKEEKKVEKMKEEKDEKKEVKEIKEESKVENKKEVKGSRPKRSLKKKEEGKKTVRKNRKETNNNNLKEDPKSQRMFIDKKEIEEMIKNELNMKNILNENITENDNDIKVENNKNNDIDSNQKENNNENNINEKK